MSYINVYPSRINWENEPSIASPINATNLNKIDYAVYEHDRTFSTWDITKANQSDLLLSLKDVSYDTDTGVFVFTWWNGTTQTVDLNIEKIPVSFSMSPQGVITMTTDDGTQYTADVGSLIKTYTFNDSSVIDFTVTTDADGNKTVTADIVDGSITGQKLQPNYLADCQSAKTDAENAADDAEDSSEDAEAWAVGERGGVPVPSTDPAYENNSKYWAQHTSSSLAGLTDTDITNPQDGDVLTYDGTNSLWKNGTPSAGGGSKVVVSTAESSLYGATVTLSDGVTTLSSTFDNSGVATFQGVTITGNLTVSASAGAQTATMTVNVPYFGNYTATLAFFSATITVAYPANGTCTITDGVTTLTASSNPMAFNIPNTGSWRATAVVDGVSKNGTAINITTDGQTASDTIQFGTINVTYADDFKGVSITCTSGGTTITKTAPLSGNTMTFYPPVTGTWTISGTYSSKTYTSTATVSSLSTPVSAILQTVPDGSTVTPVNDIQTWLACAGIQKSYTTLAQVLADNTTLLALMSDNNAVDYLVRSTDWASSGDTKLVPNMTDATHPSGEVSASSTYGGYDPYKAFDGVNGKGWFPANTNLPNADGSCYVQYDFGSAVKVNKIWIYHYYSSALSNLGEVFTLKGSNDGTNWTELKTGINVGATNTDYYYTFDNANSYRYYRVCYISTVASYNAGQGFKIQFYPASGIPDNSTAMTDIGANNYCANTLLANSTWCTAICNSTYFESVLNVKVPTMTSDTAPSGRCFASSSYSGSYPYYAFNGNNNQSWSAGTQAVGQFVGYKFASKSRIFRVSYNVSSDRVPCSFKVQASDNDYTTVAWESPTLSVTSVPTVFSIIPTTEYYGYRLNFQSFTSYVSANAIQFHGRKDV